MKLSIETIREMRAQLVSRDVMPAPDSEFKDWEVTVNGVVLGPRGSFLHHETFKDVVGQKEYDRVMAKPRVVTSYDIEDQA